MQECVPQHLLRLPLNQIVEAVLVVLPSLYQLCPEFHPGDDA